MIGTCRIHREDENWKQNHSRKIWKL